MRKLAVALVVAAVAAACSGSDDPAADPTPTLAPTSSVGADDAPTTTTTAGASATTVPIDPGEPVDLVLHNAQVVTVDEAFTIASAVAVTDGRIVAVGSDADVLALGGAATEVIDLEGRTVVPGFVEPHTHAMQVYAPDLDAMRIGHQTLLERGITTAGMPSVLPDQLTAFEEMDAADEIRVRSHLYITYNTVCGERDPGDFYREVPFERDVDLRLAVTGVKIFSDGGTCQGPALSIDYLATTPQDLQDRGWQANGDLFVTPEEIAAALREIDAAGGQSVIHAIGDVAIRTALLGVDMAGDLDQPHQIHHNSFAAMLDPEILEIYGRRDLVPVVFLVGWARACEPGRTELWESIVHHEALMTLEDLDPILDANPGIRVSWHGDGPSITGGPLQHMFSAVTTGSAETGEVCYPAAWDDHPTVGVEDALRMTTINAAAAMGFEDSLGSIEVGKVADLTIVEHDILDPDFEAAFAYNRAVATIISGTAEYCVDELCPILGLAGPSDPEPETPPPTEPERPPAGECAAPPAGMVGWWTGDESTSDIAGGNDGTLLVGAGYLDGVVGPAFSPSGSAIELTAFPDLTDGFSVETWVSFEGVDFDDYLTIFNNDRFFIRKNNTVEGGGYAAFVKLDDGSVEPRAQSGTVPTTNVWDHLAVTWDGTELRLYLNGQLEAAAPRTGTLAESAIPAQIGRGEQASIEGPVFYGRIDEFTVYDRAITADGVAAIHAAGSAGKCR